MSKPNIEVATDTGSEGSSNAVELVQPAPTSAAVHATSSDPNLVSGVSFGTNVFISLIKIFAAQS